MDGSGISATTSADPVAAPPWSAVSGAAGWSNVPPAEPAAAGADLSAAVDALGDLDAAPVHTHAARYSDVHALLQDALSDTDRGGANPR